MLFRSGPGETILVLDSPKKSKEGAVTSFAQLATNLLNSKFQFHAERYLLPGRELVKDAGGQILGHGIVDEAMLERESIDKIYLGAPYVLFKECQLSFFNPAVKRLAASPSAMSVPLKTALPALLSFSTAGSKIKT